MIPKIAWIHWHDLENMPWLRRKSVETFKKHHPDWQVWQVGTPEDIRSRGFSYAHEADWTWWRLLALHGGFLVASDVVSIGRIPDEWHDCDLCAQVDDTGNVEQFAVLGSVPENPLMKEAERRCKGTNTVSSYQQFGVDLLRGITDGRALDGEFGRVSQMPKSAYCFYGHDAEAGELWTEQGPHRQLPDSALGVHWYGGHSESKKHEPNSGPGGKSWLERLALEA